MRWEEKKEDCTGGLYNKERKRYYNEAVFGYRFVLIIIEKG